MRKLTSLALFVLMSACNQNLHAASADAPATRRALQILVVEKGELKRAAGRNHLTESLAALRRDYNVVIDGRSIDGLILDLDGKETTYRGYPLRYQFFNPLLRPFFRNPHPGNPEITEAFASLRRDVESGSLATEYWTGGAVAEAFIGHAYFPKYVFENYFYFNTKNSALTSTGFESVLHETLHIIHFRHLNEVEALLQTPGSYYDRRRNLEVRCPDFFEIEDTGSDWDDLQAACDGKSLRQLVDETMRIEKWPQRYGRYTNRRFFYLKQDDQACMSGRISHTTGTLSGCLDDATSLGDFHSHSNSFEYFAILAQLYVLSPEDFQRVATEQEKAFVERIYQSYLR